MPTIQGNEIENLITLFNDRDQKFYHACQYKDFKTYIELGGVPSRNLMESSGLPYTPFDTDATDRNNAVWNKVFGNLQDFGFSFAKGQRNPNTAPAPNPYGPILLIFNPEVFREATDVAICLRSAGGRDFNRENEALSTAAEVNRIYKYTNLKDIPVGNLYAKSYIKYSGELQEEFEDPEAMTPEISFIVEKEMLSFRHLHHIVVDPYIINNINLKERVNKIKVKNRINGAVWERLYNEHRMEIKQELANLLLESFTTIPQIIQNEENSESLHDWATRLQKGRITWLYDRFAKYLRSGTLLELQEERD